MRIVCLSDTHSLHPAMYHEIPDGDVLVHAGDFTSLGLLQEVVNFNEWIRQLPHTHKIVIAGNHDVCFEQDSEFSEAYLWDCTYLQDSGVVIEGVHFYGTPWQPSFMDWAFNLDTEEELDQKWQLIPSTTDVLLSHCPPKGILDEARPGEPLGSSTLNKRVLEIQPKLHVFGHIHESYGKIKQGKTSFVNAAICDATYSPGNRAIVVDI